MFLSKERKIGYEKNPYERGGPGLSVSARQLRLLPYFHPRREGQPLSSPPQHNQRRLNLLFKVTSVDMAVSPASIAGMSCGTQSRSPAHRNVPYRVGQHGWRRKFGSTVNNGRGGGNNTNSLTFGPGVTTMTFSFTWSGALPLDHTSPEPGGIQVTSPNQLTSSLVGPTGQCQVAQAASWKVVSSPSPGPGAFDLLNGVAAVSTNDVWAVGINSGGEGSTAQTLIEHWNGKSWQVVSSPSPATDNSLNGVAAVSATNIWAVGSLKTAVVLARR